MDDGLLLFRSRSIVFTAVQSHDPAQAGAGEAPDSGLRLSHFRLNSAGVSCPRLECGRISLYSRRNSSITTFASTRFLNHCMLRHSSRNLPLKDSFEPFCQGLPGSMCAVSMFACVSHLRTARETNSGPLSERRYLGAPCTVTSLASTSITRPERMLPATSIARHSRVYSSMTVRHLSCCPFAQASKTKS